MCWMQLGCLQAVHRIFTWQCCATWKTCWSSTTSWGLPSSWFSALFLSWEATRLWIAVTAALEPSDQKLAISLESIQVMQILHRKPLPSECHSRILNEAALGMRNRQNADMLLKVSNSLAPRVPASSRNQPLMPPRRRVSDGWHRVDGWLRLSLFWYTGLLDQSCLTIWPRSSSIAIVGLHFYKSKRPVKHWSISWPEEIMKIIWKGKSGLTAGPWLSHLARWKMDGELYLWLASSWKINRCSKMIMWFLPSS